MASFRAVRRALCSAAEAAPVPGPSKPPGGRWERIKQSKAGVWCRSLLSDYREACREVVVGARDRPLKASVYLSLVGGAYACFLTKPDQSSFHAALLDRSNRLALLSPWVRNPRSDLHVQTLTRLRNQNRLRHLSLGLVSLVYSADHDPDSALYEAACPNLSVPWRDLPGRVLDVGFGGRWWMLDRNMEDYDVNEGEFKHLPQYMQATAPPGVQEVEKNEQLHRDSWLPVVQEEEEDAKEKEEKKSVTGDTERTVDETIEAQVVQAERTVDETIEAQVVQAERTVDETIEAQVVQAERTVDETIEAQVVQAERTVDETIEAQVVQAERAEEDDQALDSETIRKLDSEREIAPMERAEENNNAASSETIPKLDLNIELNNQEEATEDSISSRAVDDEDETLADTRAETLSESEVVKVDVLVEEDKEEVTPQSLKN